MAENNLQIHLIGEFQLCWGDFVLNRSTFPRRKGRDLLKLLSLTPGHCLHREQVIDTLWPDAPFEKAENSFYNTIYLLRQVLGGAGICLGEFLLVEEEAARFNPGFPVWIDLDAFHSVADQAFRTRNLSLYQEALSLARVELLVENRYDDWAIPYQGAFQQRVLKLLHGLAELHASQQDWPSAITAYSQILAKEPVDETAHAGLMRAYAQTGQRDAAIRQYKRLERVLQEELATLPSPQTVQLLHAIQVDQVSPPSILDRSVLTRQPASTKKMEKRQVRSRRNFLPSPLSSFIGRETVISEVLSLLQEHRLVSLTGAGGVGKTRLALAIARQFLQAPAASENQGYSHLFPDGIWYLAYTSLNDPDTLLQSLAQLFGILYHRKDRLLEMLEDYLHDRKALIVLDNCEGVAKPLACLLDHLLYTSPALKILVTSRVVLGVNGEIVYYVPPLSYAVPGQLPNPEIFQQFEAIQLFTERARTVMPGFQVTAQNALAIAQICRALDGLPLAIEMAAACLNVLSLEQIHDRISSSFQLLNRGRQNSSPPHHQTLRACLDWSYALLNEAETRLLQVLSVFAGGCNLECLETVCCEEAGFSQGILDPLSGLVDQSLVYTRLGATGERRYHLLETVRQYAEQKLLESGQAQRFQERHQQFFLSLAERSRDGIWTAECPAWVHRLKDELDNLRVAIHWSYSFPQQAEKGLRIAEAVSRRFMLMMGYNAEACDWLVKGLNTENQPPISALLKARALGALAWLEFNALNDLAVRDWADASLEVCRSQGEEAQADLAWALFLSHPRKDHELDVEIQIALESVNLARNLPESQSWILTCSLNKLGGLMVQKDSQKGLEIFQESYRLDLQRGDRWSSGRTLRRIAINYHLPRLERDLALAKVEKAFKLQLEVDDRVGVFYSQIGFAEIYRETDDKHTLIAIQNALETIYPCVGPGFYIHLLNCVADLYLDGIRKRETVSASDFELALLLLSFVHQLEGSDPGFYDEVILNSNRIDSEIIRPYYTPAEFEAIWERGGGLSLDEAVILALSVNPDEIFHDLEVSVHPEESR